MLRYLDTEDTATMPTGIEGGIRRAPRTLVFTATYNERDNIDMLLDRIWSIDPAFEVLAVDDASPDGTGAHLDARAAADRRLHVVHRPGKLGLGTAHQLGMHFAVLQQFDYLITMDADLSHDPADIPRLLEALRHVDLVIGSRYAPGGSSEYQGYRKFLSVSANTLARSLLGVKTHEFTTSFRAFRVEMLRSKKCSRLRGGGYAYFMETVFRLHQAGFRIAEVPISFRDRVMGVSKIPKYEIFNGAASLFRLAGSRWLGNPSTPAPVVHSTCRGCDAPYMMEFYPPSDPEGTPGVEGYRCATMTHHHAPQIALCLQCGLMQVPRSHQPPGLAALYAAVEDPLYVENEAARTTTFEALYGRITPTLGTPGRMVEVGAYCGLFARVAIAAGWDVDGVEPSRWAVDVARSRYGVTLHQGTLDTVRLAPGYDAVVAWDVMEHLEAPFDLMIRANQLLRPGGVFAFSTLDVGNWFPKLIGRRWPWWLDMHLFYFNQALLRRWLARAGFDDVQISPYRHYASPSYLAHKLTANLPKPLQPAAQPLTRALPTQWGVPVSFGDIVLVTAKKASDTHLKVGQTAEPLDDPRLSAT